MSIKKLQLSFLILISLSFGIYRHFNPTTPPKSFIPRFNASQYSSRGIVERIIILKFETFTVRKINSTNMTEVVALVSMPFDFDGQLQYKWTLGENVTLVDGPLEGFSEKGFSKETPQKIKLLVQGFDKSQLRHVGFEIWGDQNGRRIYADGLISSQQENSFEDIVQHVEKMKAEKAGIRK